MTPAPTALTWVCGFPKRRAPVSIPKQPEFFGHPAGLFILFSTEACTLRFLLQLPFSSLLGPLRSETTSAYRLQVWERFSYYGMRALLVLYLTKVILSRGMWRVRCRPASPAAHLDIHVHSTPTRPSCDS